MHLTETRGVQRYALIWFGQLVSLIGSGLTNFALGVWVYQRTGSTIRYTLIAVCAWLPGLLILPMAGALTDRWDRRRLMILCNVGASISSLFIVALFFFERLEIWHIYLSVTVVSSFSTLLSLVFTASTSLLVPKQHFGRASGLVQVAQAAERIIPPLLAGILLTAIPIQSLIFIDFLTYFVAVLSLLLVSIPMPDKRSEQEAGQGSFLQRAFYGWTYVKARRGLVALMVYFATFNLILSFAHVLFTPMVLSFATAEVLGRLLSISGVGFLVGSIIMSLWGGPKTKVMGILGSGALFGISVFLIGVRPSVTLIAIGGFCMFFAVPILNGCSQAIWLSKTPPDIQGRVFAIRWMIGYSTVPLAYLLAGPLADKVFEPIIASGGLLSRIMGQGPGRGIGFIYCISGLLLILIQLAAYLYPRLRHMEEELPDAVGESYEYEVAPRVSGGQDHRAAHR